MISLMNTTHGFFHIFILASVVLYALRVTLFEIEFDEHAIRINKRPNWNYGKFELKEGVNNPVIMRGPAYRKNKKKKKKKNNRNNNTNRPMKKMTKKTTTTAKSSKSVKTKKRKRKGEISEHEKYLNTLVDRGELVPYKKDTKISYDTLIDLFDERPPVNKRINECLMNPNHGASSTILMSVGRSGSSSIWQMLTNLTNSTNYERAYEYAGANKGGALYFFNTTIRAEEKLASRDSILQTGQIFKRAGAKLNEVPGLDNSEHGKWMSKYLCRLIRKQPRGTLVGFQWKPYLMEFALFNEARESLQLLASLASAAAEVGQKPPIVIVRNRRNPLDVKLSDLKHELRPELPAHCDQEDELCISKHTQKKIFVERKERFLLAAETLWTQENLLDLLLYELEVPFVSVSYDALYYPDQISDGEDEWNKMIQFVSPSSANVSWADIQNSMAFAPTISSRNHADIIENWEEIYEIFKGTTVEQFFRLPASDVASDVAATS